MKGTQQITSYYGQMYPNAYQDTDYDTTDTLTFSKGDIVIGVMCSHNSPDLEVYDGASWRKIEGWNGADLGALANDVMCQVGIAASEAGTAVGSVRMSAPAVDNTKLTIAIMYSRKATG